MAKVRGRKSVQERKDLREVPQRKFQVKCKIMWNARLYSFTKVVTSVSFRGASQQMYTYIKKTCPDDINKASSIAMQVHKQRNRT